LAQRHIKQEFYVNVSKKSGEGIFSLIFSNFAINILAAGENDLKRGK
jgi:hypothetical protein